MADKMTAILYLVRSETLRVSKPTQHLSFKLDDKYNYI